MSKYSSVRRVFPPPGLKKFSLKGNAHTLDSGQGWRTPLDFVKSCRVITAGTGAHSTSSDTRKDRKVVLLFLLLLADAGLLNRKN